MVESHHKASEFHHGVRRTSTLVSLGGQAHQPLANFQAQTLFFDVLLHRVALAPSQALPSYRHLLSLTTRDDGLHHRHLGGVYRTQDQPSTRTILQQQATVLVSYVCSWIQVE